LLGEHPETGAKVKASLGRFGPYVVHDQGKDGKDYRSLKKEDDVLTVSLERALELLAQPKRGRGRKSATPLRELGVYPEGGEMIGVYDGPYGLYVKQGKVNASLPEGETTESITLEKAVELLSAKAAIKGKGKSSKAKSTTKKTTAKKTTAKKTTAKKATTKKTTAKKTTAKKTTAKSTAKRTKVAGEAATSDAKAAANGTAANGVATNGATVNGASKNGTSANGAARSKKAAQASEAKTQSV
ncbi:MAG: topoisomerase C-terminal repeat-containing protein, partial [Cyanobacteria bacterium P01_A01_bin.135]